MKLDSFSTLVEGHNVYKGKMSKGGQALLMSVLIAGGAFLVYYKFIRVPKFVFINKDIKTNRVQLKLDSKNKLFYLNGGQTLNISGVTIKSTLIKQDDSDLVTGITITETKGDKVIKEQTITY